VSSLFDVQLENDTNAAAKRSFIPNACATGVNTCRHHPILLSFFL